MTVFAWILFILTALCVLGSLFSWFADGEGLGALVVSGALVVYYIFYLFITPFNTVTNWIYFIGVCLLAAWALLRRQPFLTLAYGVLIVFFALVLF